MKVNADGAWGLAILTASACLMGWLVWLSMQPVPLSEVLMKP